MPITDWPTRWQVLHNACAYRGATGRWAEGVDKQPRFEIAPPAKDADIAAVEHEIGKRIPVSLRKVLLKYSREVCIEWALPRGIKAVMPAVLRNIWSGECRWSLNSLAALQETYRQWLEVFTDPNDYWDGPWQSKFAVLEVGNGDMLGIDMVHMDMQPVVYLSHEGDDSLHGFWLGRDFEDYVDRLSLLGCVGSEDWQLKPFVSGPRSFLDPDSNNAKCWREWFGLDLSADHGLNNT